MRKTTLGLSVLLAFSLGGMVQAADVKTKLPISDKPITLTFWAPMDANVRSVNNNYANTEYYKELAKRTNITIAFNHPAPGQEANSLNILIASGEIPDIIQGRYPTVGEEGGINDKVILDLRAGINQYMPNYKQFLDKDPAIKKLTLTASGKIGVIAGKTAGAGDDDTVGLVTGGLFMRKDWLDELKLSPPETISEMYTVLKAFKEKKGIAYPLSVSWNETLKGRPLIRGAYGISNDFFQENGKIKYGPLENGYKEWVTEMRKWYSEGLLDKEFFLLNTSIIDTRVANDQTGVIFGGIGGVMGKYLPIIQTKNPKADLVALAPLSLVKGQKAKIDFLTALTNGTWMVSAKNKYIPETLKWLDYFYSTEGNLLHNFGVEGVSYKMVNGYPTYTDLILKNPDGLAVAQALAKYAAPNYTSLGQQDIRYLEQFFVYPQQKAALKKFKSDSDKYLLTNVPFANYTTKEEQEFFSQYWSQWNTYVEEMTIKFIVGGEPISNWDTAFKDQLKKLKIDQGIQYRQAAYDRFDANN